MDEKLVRKILAEDIGEDDDLYNLGWYLSWHKGNKTAVLDGEFTFEQLAAISWWMTNKS